MLYPIVNAFRSVIDLSGIWAFRTDPNGIGEQEQWQQGFESTLEIAVPGSWNEQLEEEGLLHYVGAAWYCKVVELPAELAGKHLSLRIGSADYQAKVWVNGECLGENDLGFLPFAFPLDGVASAGQRMCIVIRVSNVLSDETIPQGISSEQYAREGRMREETFPPARFDFSPFGGIHRPVKIVATPMARIEQVTVRTALTGTGGSVSITVETAGADGASISFLLQGNGGEVTSSSPIAERSATCDLAVERCRPWCPEDPYLYTLEIRLMRDGAVIDAYQLSTGIREVVVDGARLLLNGKPVYLQGFGKHEDAFAVGKGLHLPLMVKDFSLMKWMGANSFRTSHYPYAEEMMFHADRAGILVIDEVPAVSLDFRYVREQTLAHHREYVRRLIERDGNHPSVIIWALGNEPNLVGEDGYQNGNGRSYWQNIFSYARTLDPTRPMAVPNCLRATLDDPALEFSDIICLNRYYGWYEYPGRLDRAAEALGHELDCAFERYKRPVMLTEFGADTIPGLHSTSDQMFTEEYQERLLITYIGVIRSKEFTVGEHVWNFADFRTPQNLRRVVLNMKGVFTRSRSPKVAAFALRKVWRRDGR